MYSHFASERRKFYSIFIKVVSRCNLNCAYCHWYRDESALINAVEGNKAKYPGIEFNPINVFSITPSGEIEPHDVLRIKGEKQVSTGLRWWDWN